VVEVESRGVVSVVVGGKSLDCFWELRRRVRVERVDWEERIVETLMLRCALREETMVVRGDVDRKRGCLLCAWRDSISVSNCALTGSSEMESSVDGIMAKSHLIV